MTGTCLLCCTRLVLQEQSCEAAPADALRVRRHRGKAHSGVARQARHNSVAQLLVRHVCSR